MSWFQIEVYVTSHQIGGWLTVPGLRVDVLPYQYKGWMEIDLSYSDLYKGYSVIYQNEKLGTRFTVQASQAELNGCKDYRRLFRRVAREHINRGAAGALYLNGVTGEVMTQSVD